MPPKILSATADDPDMEDYVYSSGDTIDIAFDRPTDRAGGSHSGNKDFVDDLFAFTQRLAYDYSGAWLPGVVDGDSVFRITLLQATCPGCTPMPEIATVRPTDTASIRTRAGSSPRAAAPSPPLVGDYGKTRGPQIVSFVADDFDNGDNVFGSGDTLTIVLDIATDRGGTDERATSVNVEDMLVFSHSLGTDVLSQWSDDSTLVVTVISPTGADDVRVGKTTVRPRREVRNKGCCGAYTREGCARGTACCCYNATDIAPVPLAGDFGNRLPPTVASFVGDDPDDGDAEYGGSDVLLVTFDMATNRGQGDPFGGKSWVDDLLWFSLPIGDDYSGEWVEEDKVVRISILEPASTRASLPESAYACSQLPGVAPAPPKAPGWSCFDGVAPVALLNVSDAYWTQTLVAARGDGYDNDGDGNGGDIRNRAGSSNAAGVPPVVMGQLGNLGAPSIVRFDVDDPNNGDISYGDGDVLTITLDRPVDRTDMGGSRESIDRLFGFTTPLGESYRGQWNDTSTFVIVVEEIYGAGAIERGATRVHASVRDDAIPLRNRAGCQGVEEGSCLMPFLQPPLRLVGDFGVLAEPPVLLSATIQDYDNTDAVYSTNDTITVRFDRPTDSAGGARGGGRSFVDALLNFSTPLGNDYAGQWSDDGRDLVVTTLDAGNGTVSLDLQYDENGTVVVAPTYVTVVGHMRTQSGNSPPSWANLTKPLEGDVGNNATSCCDPNLSPAQRLPSCCALPRVVGSVGEEVKRGEEWTLTLSLDRASDRGRTRLPEGLCPEEVLDRGDRIPQECVELLFSFTPTDALTFPEPDATVHGRWHDDSTFVVTTTLDLTTPDVKFGETQQENLQIGTKAFLYTSGLLVNGTQHCDEQEQFSHCVYMTPVAPPDVPKLVGFTVEDRDNLDAVLSVGDEYHIMFDRDTDQHLCEPVCSGGLEYISRLFVFSEPLASDYVGEWRDNRTFTITVTRVDEGFIAPRISNAIVALRPPNVDLQANIEADVAEWLVQARASYQELINDEVADQLRVRTADGLSGFATHECLALTLDACDDPDTGLRPVPILNGTYGVLAAPHIVRFEADDPDDFDEVYSAGDTLTIGLDIASDALQPPRESEGEKLFVDDLFAFSHSLGADYSGAWTDASTFVIRIIDVAGAGAQTMSGPCEPMNRTLASLPEDDCEFHRLVLPEAPAPLPPGSTGYPPPPPSRPSYAPAYVEWPPPVYAFFNASALLTSISRRGQTTSAPTPLTGSFGVSVPPTLLSWTAADLDNADPTYSAGDTLSLVFDMATNQGGALLPTSGGKAYVDTLLEFSDTLGLDYSAAWTDASTFVITVVDAAEAEPPRIGITRVTVRHGEHNVTNEHGSSVGCMDSAMLKGSFGSARPPRLVSVTIDDEDNGDEVYGYCDTLTFTFDMATDKAGRANIDVYDLFHFANPLDASNPECDVPFAGECPVYDVTNGLKYESHWAADGSAYTVQLECPAPAGTPTAAAANLYAGAQQPPYLAGNSTTTFVPYVVRVAKVQLGVTRVRLRADVRNTARNLNQPLLRGEFGSVEAPFIVSYVASNYENADAIYGEADLLTISFDKPTDKAGGERYGLKNYVDGLFSFSEGDPADDYSGEWRDDSTFVVRLIDPTDIIPSVEGLVPFSTRPSDLRVSTAGGEGLSGAIIQNRGVSMDRVASASIVVPVSGNFGKVRSPQLVGFEARDLDNGDAVISEGDELVLTFDVATDRGGAQRTFYASDMANMASRTEVDRLFSFSSSLGSAYTGLWIDESTLVVTILNSTDADAQVSVSVAHVRDELGGLVFNAAGNSAAAQGSRTLTGSFGSLDAPAITSFSIEDVDNADIVYGEGDVLVIGFDRLTDTGGAGSPLRGAEAFVDALFSFSHVLGDRYSGAWEDASSFTITIINATDETVTTDGVALQPAGVRVTPAATALIRNRAGVSAVDGAVLPPATDPSPKLELRDAGVGSLDAPLLLTFVAGDPDGGDPAYGVGDQLVLTFRGRSNRGAHMGGQDFVDSLFEMVPALGADCKQTCAPP